MYLLDLEFPIIPENKQETALNLYGRIRTLFSSHKLLFSIAVQIVSDSALKLIFKSELFVLIEMLKRNNRW